MGLLPTHCPPAMDSAAIQAAYVQSAFAYIEVRGWCVVCQRWVSWLEHTSARGCIVLLCAHPLIAMRAPCSRCVAGGG